MPIRWVNWASTSWTLIDAYELTTGCRIHSLQPLVDSRSTSGVRPISIPTSAECAPTTRTTTKLDWHHNTEFVGEQSLDRRSEGETISIIRGRIIEWIIEPHTESWVDETAPGYAHLPTIRSSTVRGMLPKIAYTTTYGGWCPTIMGALTEVRHCVDNTTQPLLSAGSLLWTPMGREHIELAGHEIAIHMLESGPCTLFLSGQVVKQRASDIEDLRRHFSQGISTANPSKVEARVAVAFIAPELSPEPSVQIDTRAALRLYDNRLSPA